MRAMGNKASNHRGGTGGVGPHNEPLWRMKLRLYFAARIAQTSECSRGRDQKSRSGCGVRVHSDPEIEPAG